MNFNLLGLSPATKIALSIVMVLLLMVAGLSVEYWMITSVIRHSEAQWCDTLSLLTERPVAKPADPKANPSREGQYLFYVNLVQLKEHFGCR